MNASNRASGPQPAAPGRNSGPQPAAPIVSVPPSVPQMPTFNRVSGGFHPQQVADHLGSLWDEIQKLRHQVATLTQHAARGAAEAVGNPRAQQLIEDVVQLAMDEIAGHRAEAAAEASRILQDAAGRANAVVTSARNQAGEIMAGAQAQAQTVVGDARDEARGMLDNASAKSAAVDATVARRVAQLQDQHDQVTARLKTIRDHAAALLDSEDTRGPLAGELDRALPVPGNGTGPLPELTGTPQA